ncbi:MAG: class I SAM-dependent methyltransferase [Chlorobium sp.]|uniref:class I SAM-dependent methyltransferase n=1 Tax=Chlorobium sp. TaxID=1095 RepID=UPI002F41FAA5
MLDLSLLSNLPAPIRLSPPWSWAGHIPFAMWFIQQEKPRVIVELGTHSGHSYFAFCQSIRHFGIHSRSYAIDTWKGDKQTGFYSADVYQEVLRHNKERYSDFSTLLRTTFDDAIDTFADHSIDLLHIDGLHTYEAVSHDFASWLPKISPHGTILFHDIAVRAGDFGVWKLWEEISSRYPQIAFEHSHGLGVLFPGNAPGETARQLTEAWQHPQHCTLMKTMFTQAGENLEYRTLCHINRDELLQQKELTITEQKKIIAVQKRQIKLMDAAIHDCQNLNIKKQNQLSRILNSQSWHIIKPLWKLSKSIKKRTTKQNPSRDNHDRNNIHFDKSEYQQWIDAVETYSYEQLQNMAQEIALIPSPPRFSIIMPVYNPSTDFLNEAICSVQSQLYPHWELCIADDHSPNEKVREIIMAYACQDERIKYRFRNKNGHISEASNTSLELATGDYIALFDHDDKLHPLALYWNAKELINHPDASIIYSDEDKIDESGRRLDPYFKCDFNYDLFLCQNMISHLGVYKTALIRTIGGFRKEFEGSQDYDLALRAIESIKPEQIRHIPRILYHWRIHKESTAKNINRKPYALIAATKAIQEHLSRMGVDATVTQSVDAPIFSRIMYNLPEPVPSVEILIIYQGAVQCTIRCIKTLLDKTDFREFTVRLINFPDEHEGLSLLAKDSRLFINKPASTDNYSTLLNTAASSSIACYLCILHDNLEIIDSGWLKEMLGHAIQPNIGAVGAKLVSPDGRLKHCGIIMGIHGMAGYPHRNQLDGSAGYSGRKCLQQQFSALAGGCLLLKRTDYLAVDGMEESSLHYEMGQIDLTLKLSQRGLRNIWTPYAKLQVHEITGERKKGFFSKWTIEESLHMQHKWSHIIEHDPAYNPNLTLISEDFQPALPL